MVVVVVVVSLLSGVPHFFFRAAPLVSTNRILEMYETSHYGAADDA